jgi:putative glycosyl hydrolase-like family 6 (GHL6) protein
MPVMGLVEWKQAVDCFAEDDANTLILWTAGGFRSQKFPITWQYNAEHANIRHDFVRELIDYAHTKNIRVLLGFTPFGYDGTNRYPIEHPKLKARKPDGSPVDEFGIDSRGWNLCPAQAESQRFMREYIDEMVFDFYPNADGLLIESSDYAICNCPDCGPQYYDHEFKFVRELSGKLWKRKPEATILVFPHYFTGAKVPGIDATAAKQPFDSRWGLIFAPHSAHFDDTLIHKAKTSVFWSDATALHTPREVAAAAQTARQHGVVGFIPSLEAFSYIPDRPEAGEPWVVGKRHLPFGFDPTAEGKMPYNMLPVRVQRFAYRAFSQNPELKYSDFERQLGEHFFGAESSPAAAADLLELQRIWSYDGDWYWSSPLLDPDFFTAHAKRLRWPNGKLATYEKDLSTLRKIAAQNVHATNENTKEMARLAKTVVDRWDAVKSTPSQAQKAKQ